MRFSPALNGKLRVGVAHEAAERKAWIGEADDVADHSLPAGVVGAPCADDRTNDYRHARGRHLYTVNRAIEEIRLRLALAGIG